MTHTLYRWLKRGLSSLKTADSRQALASKSHPGALTVLAGRNSVGQRSADHAPAQALESQCRDTRRNLALQLPVPTYPVQCPMHCANPDGKRAWSPILSCNTTTPEKAPPNPIAPCRGLKVSTLLAGSVFPPPTRTRPERIAVPRAADLCRSYSNGGGTLRGVLPGSSLATGNAL